MPWYSSGVAAHHRPVPGLLRPAAIADHSPPAVLGGMLFYSGLDLIHPLKSTDSKDIFLFAAVVVLSIALNPAVGFAAGIAIFLLSKRLKSNNKCGARHHTYSSTYGTTLMAPHLF